MTKGEELLASLNGVRDFLNDLGQLLVAGDTLLAAEGWESYAGNACHQGASGSVLEGRRWIPRAVFRRYYNGDEYPNVIAMISLLLDDQDYFELTEPLVCGVYFVFPEGTDESDVDVDPWNAQWPGWRVEAYDGVPAEVDDKDEEWKEGWGWRYMQTFARPLVEVTNQTALKEKIIDPLLALIEAHVSSPADAARKRAK